METILTHDHSRRDVLATAGAMLAASASISAGAARAASPRPAYPPDVGRKFSPDGRVLPFAGNTIICHVPQQGSGSETFDALLDIYRQLPGHAFGRKVTALPPSSYHMTIFGGANDGDRKPGLWPADLPLDLPMAECDRILGERLQAFQLDCALPLRMRVNLDEPAASERPLTIRLLPVDAEEQRKLSRLRDRLADLLRIRAPGHDTYRFHITLGYLTRWLTPAEDADYRLALKAWREGLAKQHPVIELGAPEYCLLTDMFAFKRQFYLR